MKEVVLTTNTRLKGETVSALIKMTSEKFGTENVVHVTDDRIIGGFTLKCDGVFYDMSVSSQLDRLKETLQSEEADI